jgi:hypothetical protein
MISTNNKKYLTSPTSVHLFCLIWPMTTILVGIWPAISRFHCFVQFWFKILVPILLVTISAIFKNCTQSEHSENYWNKTNILWIYFPIFHTNFCHSPTLTTPPHARLRNFQAIYETQNFLCMYKIQEENKWSKSDLRNIWMLQYK